MQQGGAWSPPSQVLNTPPALGVEDGDYMPEFDEEEIIAEGGIPKEECMLMSSHSLKSTLLLWCSKSARVTFEDRRLLGHHMDRKTASRLCYSRDEATRLASHDVLLLIKRGYLEPDLPRVRRLRSLIDQGVTIGRHAILEKDYPISHVGSDDCASQDLEGEGTDELSSLYPNAPDLMRMSLSGMSFLG